MLDRWTYGWFGQPASIQTVQKSQDQSHLQFSLAGHSSPQPDHRGIRPTTRVRLLEGSEWEGNGEEEISPTSADSFKTAPDGYGTTRASGNQQVRFEEASSLRPVQRSRREIPRNPPHPPSRPPLPAPTISSNTINRLKAQLSSRSLPPKSPPLQSIPDQLKNENRSELYDIWPSPQHRDLPPLTHNFDDRNMMEPGKHGKAGFSVGNETRERHRDGRKEWQDNRESQPYRNEPHLTRRDPYLSDPSFRFPLQLDHSQFDSTHPQVDPTLPYPNLDYPQQDDGRYHPLEFDGQPHLSDQQDSPSFPFPAHEPELFSHDSNPTPHARSSSIDSEATLHEASQFSPNRPISTPHQLTSTIPFSSHSRHKLNPHGVVERGSGRQFEEHRRTAEEWERSVEEEVRKRIELERRLGGFESRDTLEGTQLRSSRENGQLERGERSSENPSLSSRSTSSIGFFPELPPQPEMFFFEGLLLVPPPNFTSLTEIAQLHHSHWIPYHAILTTRSLHFLVNSNPSTQTPILVLDFERCKSLNKPRELRDRGKLFSFVVEMQNGKKRYFACESGRDWMTWTNKIRELIYLAHGRAPPTLENALDFDANSNDSNRVPPGLLSRPPLSRPAAPTSASPGRSTQIRHHLADLEQIFRTLDHNAQRLNARNDTKGNQPQDIDPQPKRRYQESNEDWMARFNEDVQVRAFMDADPNNPCQDEWRSSQPPYPPASPAPRPHQDPPRRLRKPRPRTRSIGITPEELDLARSIFEDLSKSNAAADGEVGETRWGVIAAGKRIKELRDSIGARIEKGDENEITKGWIDRLEYLSAINDTRLKGHCRDASLGQGGFDVASSQGEEDALRVIHEELKNMLHDGEGNRFDEKRWWRNDEKGDLTSSRRTRSRERQVTDHLVKSSRAPHPSPQELLNLFRDQQHHLEESRRFQQDQSGALASLVRDLHANQKILSDPLPKVQQALSFLRTINDPSANSALATDTSGHLEGGRNRSNDIPLSKILPLETPRKDYHLIPSDGRIADRAIPPSQAQAWRQGDQLNRRGSGNKEGVRFWGVPDPISSSYHRSRLKGGLEAARAAKEIVQFDTIQQELALPPPYEANTITSRRSTLQIAVYEALSKLAEKRNKKGATEKQ